MTVQPNSPEARDIALPPAWLYQRPQASGRSGPLVIEKGDGIYVEDMAGKRYIEAMAGLWSVARRLLGEAAGRRPRRGR